MSTEPSPARDASAATSGSRFAPVGRRAAPRRRPDAAWAWTIFWLVLATLYGLYGSEFNDGLYESIIQTLAYVMMALGLNIVVGFAGLLDLGYVAFFAIGAFVAGLVHVRSTSPTPNDPHPRRPSQTQQLPGIHINFFFVICIAAAFTALWGAILGAPTLRLRGDYLAIVTLAFGEIVPRVFELSTSGPFGIGNLDISNGRQGITPVDKPYLPVPGLDEITRIDITPFYFIALGMMLVVLFVNVRLRDSRLGRAWIAVREDEVAAAAMGVQPRARQALGLRDRRRRSAASPACSWACSRTRSTSTSSSSGSRSSSSA